MDIDNKKDKPFSYGNSPGKENMISKDELFLDFNYFYEILRRRWRIFYFTSIFSFSAILIFTGFQRIINPSYRGFFKILISDPITKKDYVNDSLRSKPFAVFDYGVRTNEILSNDIPTLIEYLKSEIVLEKVLNEFKIDYYSLNRDLSVEILDQSQTFESDPEVISVVLHHKNKKEGLKILKALANTYLEASLKVKQRRLSDGLKFLDSQEPELKENSKVLRDRLSLFREKNNLLDPNKEALTLKKRLNILEDQILKLESERERLKIIEKEIKKGNLISSGLEISENEGKLTGGLGLFVTDANQSILKELVELKNIYANYLTKYLPSSELVKGIENRISFLEPVVLQKQLESVKSALELKIGTIEALKKQKDQLNKSFLRQPKYISDYQELGDKLALALEKEKALVRARENFQLEITQRNIPWLIIKKPFFEKVPIENKKRFLLLSLLGSSGFAFLTILIRDLSENVFYNKKSIKNSFSEKILSGLPFFESFKKDKKSLIESLDYYLNYELKNNDYNYKFLFYKESMRGLYADLSFIFRNKKFKILSLCSSVSGEGKTLISTIIAKMFSLNNYKVLIVDADMRRPTLHKNFSLENKSGLSNFLSEKKLDLDKYIVKMNDNLSVMTSGSSDSDPIKILSSGNMEKFIENIRESYNYDLVIFDTPPVIGFSDFKLICKDVDGLIFLISLGFSKKYLIKRAYEEINNYKFNLLGFITNSLITNDCIKGENQILNYYKGNRKSSGLQKIIYKFRNNKKLIKFIRNLKKFYSWLNN